MPLESPNLLYQRENSQEDLKNYRDSNLLESQYNRKLRKQKDSDAVCNYGEQYATNETNQAKITPGFNKMSGIDADPEFAGHSVDERRVRR